MINRLKDTLDSSEHKTFIILKYFVFNYLIFRKRFSWRNIYFDFSVVIMDGDLFLTYIDKTTKMTKDDSEQQFYMIDARCLPVQKTKGSSYRRHSIDVRLEERKLGGNMRKVNSLDQSNSQHEFSTCIKKYGESIILENEEPGKMQLIKN